jgi:hypothetical protein
MKHVQISMCGGRVLHKQIPPGVHVDLREYQVPQEGYHPVLDESGGEEAPELNTLLPCLRDGEIVTEDPDGNPVRKMPASVRTDECGMVVEIEVGQDADGPITWSVVIENCDGVPLLLIYLPRPGMRHVEVEAAAAEELARRAGDAPSEQHSLTPPRPIVGTETPFSTGAGARAMKFQTTAGATLHMTADQARRWNDGDITEADCDSIIALVPTSEPDRSYVRDGEVVVHPGLPTTWQGSLRQCEEQHAEWYRDCIENMEVKAS